MAVNPIANTGRNLPMSPQVTANGGYTLPQQVYIPHPSLQVVSRGSIPAPQTPVLSQMIYNHPGTTARPLTPTQGGVPTHGIRLAIRKATPGING